jgi:hypothetical protein
VFVSQGGWLWVVFAVREQSAINEIPVYKKSPLQGVDCSPLHLEHRVAPLFRDVAQGDVHTTDEACLSIDDNELAVIAVVNLAGK